MIKTHPKTQTPTLIQPKTLIQALYDLHSDIDDMSNIYLYLRRTAQVGVVISNNDLSAEIMVFPNFTTPLGVDPQIYRDQISNAMDNISFKQLIHPFSDYEVELSIPMLKDHRAPTIPPRSGPGLGPRRYNLLDVVNPQFINLLAEHDRPEEGYGHYVLNVRDMDFRILYSMPLPYLDPDPNNPYEIVEVAKTMLYTIIMSDPCPIPRTNLVKVAGYTVDWEFYIE